MKKIVLCSYDGHNYFGGPYEWAKRIGKEWRKRGYKVVYLFLSDHPKNKSSVYQYVLREGFEAYHLGRHSLSQWHDNTEDRVAWFVKMSMETRPDIFIANSVLEALYACPQIEYHGVKCFGVYHSDDYKQLWVNDLFVQQRTHGPSNMVFVSEFLLDKYEGETKFNFVIGCGTDFIEKKAIYSDKPYKLVYTGKIVVEQKQIYKHLDAFDHLVKVFKDRIEIHIYGAGVEEIKVKQRLENNRQIVFKGFLSSDDIQKVLLQYQSFVLLSDYEGLPISLMEAMAVGLVPICLDIRSGIPELIDHEVNGFIVKNREDAFEGAVMQLANDSGLWERMSLAAKEKISQQYSTTAVADQWEKAFQKGKLGPGNVKLVLPEVHPLLAGQDVRKIGLLPYLKAQLWRIVRFLKRF